MDETDTRTTDPLRRLRERFRGVTLGWGGLLIATAAAMALTYAWFLSGGSSPESSIRAFYESPRGGSAPHEYASAIRVTDCYAAEPRRDPGFYRCSLSARGRDYETCFELDLDNHVEGGPTEVAGPDCPAVVYNPRVGRLVTLPYG